MPFLMETHRPQKHRDKLLHITRQVRLSVYADLLYGADVKQATAMLFAVQL